MKSEGDETMKKEEMLEPVPVNVERLQAYVWDMYRKLARHAADNAHDVRLPLAVMMDELCRLAGLAPKDSFAQAASHYIRSFSVARAAKTGPRYVLQDPPVAMRPKAPCQE